MTNKYYIPTPVFDTFEEVMAQHKKIYADENPLQIISQWLDYCFFSTKITVPLFAPKDYQMALNFLHSYRGSADTFTAYRRDLERFLQWSWFVRNQSLLEHKRENIESFIEFCLKPSKRWIGLKTVARFKTIHGEKRPNPEWRPFEAHINKKNHKDGLKPDKDSYQFSQQSLKVMFGILSSFYNYLLQEEVAQVNPIALIRQKSKFIQKQAKIQPIRRLSNQQWETVVNLAKEKALKAIAHERTVFILSCLYGMYLRISELTARPRWTPTMGDFYKDSEGNWWFKTVGKGNKARQIAVSNAMLNALKHYRVTYLKLPPFPSLDEKIPLIPHAKNPNTPLTSERPIRRLIQVCFDQAADYLETNGDQEEANNLRMATVHWLRHTGISEDVKHRPREHVRDDAGHSSSAITDKYIDIELRERHKTARNKMLTTENA
ncbi:MAG: site-specific integrase [Alphaproteobacteria bacterium]|nr:site-specific integrase [Alphaproteobacteria bacterium]MBP9776233.1 site-specific integrase [Alphaproteobacteria bacterium]